MILSSRSDAELAKYGNIHFVIRYIYIPLAFIYFTRSSFWAVVKQSQFYKSERSDNVNDAKGITQSICEVVGQAR